MQALDLIERAPSDVSWSNVEVIFETLARARESGVVPSTRYVSESFDGLAGTPLSVSERAAAFAALVKVVHRWIEKVRAEERTRLPYLDLEIHAFAKRLGRYSSGKTYDAFLSHASEDKQELVTPLVEALTKRQSAIWYDSFEIQPGMSIRRSIVQGLRSARYGIVVLSPHFLRKGWTQWTSMAS